MACEYCYQEPQREAGNTNARGAYDIELMIKNGLRLGGVLTVFGGEALLVPKRDLERIVEASFNRFGRSSIQTNGDLIDDGHIKLFKRFNVAVGVSIDGPGELNSLRVDRRTGDANDSTERTMINIKRLRAETIPVSIITTLHRANGTGSNLSRLKDWGGWLASIGIPYVNIHNLESESWYIKQKFALSPKEETEAMLSLAEFVEDNPVLRWAPFIAMKNLLQSNQDDVNCIWHHCDPLTTPAVQAVLADGSMTNCGRVAKEGIPWVKPDQAGYERYISLYQTPQELGGCKDCRFFLMCGGECPGTGFGDDGPDWRLKTDHCGVLMTLFEFYESRLLKDRTVPLSLHPNRKRMEAEMIRLFTQGRRPSNFVQLLGSEEITHSDTPHQDSHGDHHDAQNT